MSFEFSSVEKAKTYAYFKQVEGIYLWTIFNALRRAARATIDVPC